MIFTTFGISNDVAIPVIVTIILAVIGGVFKLRQVIKARNADRHFVKYKIQRAINIIEPFTKTNRNVNKQEMQDLKKLEDIALELEKANLKSFKEKEITKILASIETLKEAKKKISGKMFVFPRLEADESKWKEAFDRRQASFAKDAKPIYEELKNTIRKIK